MDCEHNYTFYKNISYRQPLEYRAMKFVSTDYFNCAKCGVIKKERNEITVNQADYHLRPDWCMNVNDFRIVSE